MSFILNLSVVNVPVLVMLLALYHTNLLLITLPINEPPNPLFPLTSVSSRLFLSYVMSALKPAIPGLLVNDIITVTSSPIFPDASETVISGFPAAFTGNTITPIINISDMASAAIFPKVFIVCSPFQCSV